MTTQLGSRAEREDASQVAASAANDSKAAPAGRGFLQKQLTAVLDIVLGVLALVTLALLLVELTIELPEPWSSIVVDAQIVIWIAFGVAFAFELLLAPSKMQYLRSNWLLALSLVLPALRVLRVARALRVLRTTRAARAFGLAQVSATFNRVYLALRGFFRTSHLSYLVALTLVVVATGGVAGYFFEREETESIHSLWDGVWWAATLVTTINSQAEEVTPEGRIVGLALRIFGIAVFGYLTAHLAVFLLGGHAQREEEKKDIEELSRSVRDLSRAVEELRQTTAQLTNGSTSSDTNPRPGSERNTEG